MLYKSRKSVVLKQPHRRRGAFRNSPPESGGMARSRRSGFRSGKRRASKCRSSRHRHSARDGQGTRSRAPVQTNRGGGLTLPFPTVTGNVDRHQVPRYSAGHRVTKFFTLRMAQQERSEAEKLNNLHRPEIVPFVVERMASLVQKKGFPRSQRHLGSGGLGRGTNVVACDMVLQTASKEHRF